MEVILRKATLKDILDIATLINMHAIRGTLLPRSLEEIRHSIGDWTVAISGSEVVACGSLLSYSRFYTEVRSVAVSDSCIGRGIGKALVSKLIDEARNRSVSRLFALTREVQFFEQLGFTRASSMDFPEKVWRDCLLCSRQETCDEIAVVLSLNGKHQTIGNALN